MTWSQRRAVGPPSSSGEVDPATGAVDVSPGLSVGPGARSYHTATAVHPAQFNTARVLVFGGRGCRIVHFNARLDAHLIHFCGCCSGSKR
jgi:hypothetical protein